MSLVVLVSLLTFLHYVAAQIRGPVIPLYAAAHGATATGVGLIVGAHMAAAAAGSIPLGHASDRWGRRPLLLGGMALGVVTSLLLPLAHDPVALLAIYGLAGVGVAAFSPSALSLVGDAAPPGRTGHAFAWYSTAHYGAIGIGPFVGGLLADGFGYRAAFVGSGIGIAVALAAGLALPIPSIARRSSYASFGDIADRHAVWAGWLAAASGLLLQGVVFTFFPLLAMDRGLTPSAIGVVFLVLGLTNTAARFPAGWLMDRGAPLDWCGIGGVVVAAAITVVMPHVTDWTALLTLVATFGAASGIAFVALGAALAGAATPASRGLVMGGYSTALYLGFAVGSLALGPVITRHGYVVGFAGGGLAGAGGAAAAAWLWKSRGIARRASTWLAPRKTHAGTARACRSRRRP